MKYAADFRKIARDALKGRWIIAVAAGLIAMLLGGVAYEGSGLKWEFGDQGLVVQLQIAGKTICSTADGIAPGLLEFLAGRAAAIVIAALIAAALYFVLGSVISVGYSRFNLELTDRVREPELGTLFGYFRHWKATASTKLLQTVYVLLWSLLFLIPGILAAYSYAMTGYILAENPELTAGEALRRSKEMMSGNRWRLFCLQFSFIGWSILCSLTLGIGNLFLTPYREAAGAAFYREVSGTERRAEDNAPEFL